MPNRNNAGTQNAPVGSIKAAEIGTFGIIFENMCGVIDGVKMPFAAGIIVVGAGLLVIPNTLRTLWMITVIVILMDGENLRGNVNHVGMQLARVIEEPVIPPDTTDDQRWHVVVETARQKKIVDGVARLLNAGFAAKFAGFVGGSVGKFG